MSVTLAEATAQIRLIDRFCRGPRVLTAAQISTYSAEFQACQTLADMVTLKESLETIHGLDKLPVASTEEASSRISNLIYAYSDTVGKPNPCNQDVNTLILAGPLDGQEHIVTCPTCGEQLDYIPAVYDIQG